MPIIDLQRRMVEVGRLRMGEQVPYVKDGVTKYRAAKLANWRITSRDRQRLEAAAALYGGEVREWEAKPGEFELYTKTAEVAILLVPGQTLSQWYEVWSGGGCQRRCDGEREMLSDAPCICDGEKGDRKCKPTTRLSVMLPDVPGLGVYRLESHGYYAAVELAGTSAMLETATAKGQLLPARLRIDQRSKVEGGKTTKYAVPVIDIDITMRQALPAAAAPAALGQGFTPLPQRNGVTVDQGIAAVSREVDRPVGNGRQAAAIGPAPDDILFTPTEPIPAGDEPIPADVAPEVISESQRKLLWATVGDLGVPEPALRAIVRDLTGQESTKQIPRGTFEKVLNRLEANRLERDILAFARMRGTEDKVLEAMLVDRGAAEQLEWLRNARVRAVELAGGEEKFLAAIEVPA